MIRYSVLCLFVLVPFQEMSTETIEQENYSSQKNYRVLFDFKLETGYNFVGRSTDRLLGTAPCPPPWDMAMLFTTAICLNCEQRIRILQRCLEDWNTKPDCENINNCQNCISCDICKNDDPVTSDVNNTKEDNKTHPYTTDSDVKDDEKTMRNNDTSVMVGAIIGSLCGTGIIIIILVNWYKNIKKNQQTHKRKVEKEDKVLTAETQTTLLSEEANYNESLNLKEKMKFEKSLEDIVFADG